MPPVKNSVYKIQSHGNEKCLLSYIETEHLFLPVRQNHNFLHQLVLTASNPAWTLCGLWSDEQMPLYDAVVCVATGSDFIKLPTPVCLILVQKP